ncbi:hypothetical protein FDP41_007054 [Naegleria fowleri]|uniref:Uncharacterized protein n=1 Tax=Naegleria fowleri TaxID=5763 RepID=A0A6A5B8B3_NAEFO|nr:uncharacterized protein FDP41_007054 [Naegleria fowleri]KAF0973667.1 hypothetical protein FDP41_007054 [Naegleria fowleri]CAG4707704.1 unnamed protein product [Naegleria fowleri]
MFALQQAGHSQETLLLSQEEIHFILSHTIFGSSTNSHQDAQHVVEQEEADVMNFYSLSQLQHDYTEDTAQHMIQLFSASSGLDKFLPCLHIPGIGTRYLLFHSFLSQLQQEEDLSQLTPRKAFLRFANYLGRTRSYRALALTEDEYNKILQQDSIHPTGRLKTTRENVEQMVQQYGIWKICHARLYIGQRMVPYDPSLSLHDHPETATCIAKGYMSLPHRKIYLMELQIPLIEVLGFKVKDVSYTPQKRWFYFGKIWFDSFDEATERYTLYEIPFLSKRLMKVRVFEDSNEVENFLQPFRESQEEKKRLCNHDLVEEEESEEDHDDDDDE